MQTYMIFPYFAWASPNVKSTGTVQHLALYFWCKTLQFSSISMCYSSHLIKVSFITREVFCYEFFNFCNAFCGTLLVTVHIQVHQYRIKDILKLRLTKQTRNHESKVILCILLSVHTFAISCYSILNNNFLGVLHFILSSYPINLYVWAHLQV